MTRQSRAQETWAAGVVSTNHGSTVRLAGIALGGVASNALPDAAGVGERARGGPDTLNAGHGASLLHLLVGSFSLQCQ